MKPVHPATLRYLGRNLNDLALATWLRAVESDPDGMSFVILTADAHTLRDEWNFTCEAAREVIDWRDGFLADQRDKAAEDAAARELNL